ncbi:MAG TPA: ubiquinol-cytochrome c reductase iron-sulfur subunit [Rhodocyclaceae bacterium]|nr:ubiquinol-cytochrome c reductase iron-sulfur subunit [Rhodocyclaceae bacterium]
MSDDKHGSAVAHSSSGCEDCSRRNLLIATTVVGGAAGVGAAVPFVASFMPSERAKAAGAPVEADISKLEPGTMMTVEWQGKPVWIIHRTKEQLATLDKDTAQLADPNSVNSDQPDYIKGPYRSIKPEYMVCVGICTHLGCSPSPKFAPGNESGMGSDWPGGFLCPCHGSTFDLAARVFKNKPAPDNLVIPPYRYVNDTTLMIGEDTKGA